MRVGINGFGRIGRMFVRQAREEILEGKIEIAGINDLTKANVLAYLLSCDSVHGKYPGEVGLANDRIVIDKIPVAVTSEKEPANIPWENVDVVIESTGRFTFYESEKGGAADHRASHVIISAPAGDPRIQTIVIGANEKMLDRGRKVYSMASCTTNCLAPVAKVMDEKFGIALAFMDTVHAYTGDQNILDQPHRDLRRARAAAVNMVPTSTGAASAIGVVLPRLAGKISGQAVRVPVPDGSLISLTALLEKEADAETINRAFEECGVPVIEYSREPLVSTDIIGRNASAVFDSALTQSIGRMANVKAWYDNECQYAKRLAEFAIMVSK